MLNWTGDMKTGNSLMDNEHKLLLDALNDLIKARELEKEPKEIDQTMQFLNDYLENHFSSEEDMWARYGYPDFEKHKEEHLKFRDMLHQFKEEFEKGTTIEYLGKMHKDLAQWLHRHFKEEDQKVADHIKSKDK